MKLCLLASVVTCCLSISSISHANNTPISEKLNIDLSYLLNDARASDGSTTQKQNLAGNAKYQRRQGVWGQELLAEAVNSQSSGSSNSSVERYLAAAKATHYSTDTFYQFGRLQLEKDLNSAFDYQGNLTAGLGYEILRDDVQFLTTEAGVGVRHSKQKLAAQDTSNEFIATVGLAYERKISDTLKFNQDLAYEYGADAQVVRARSAFSATLSQYISGIVSYQLKDTRSDDGDSRDALTSIGLKYSR